MNHIESPAADDGTIERELQARNATAPRVTPADIDAAIVSEHYFTGAEGMLGAAQWGAETVNIVGGSWKRESAADCTTFCILTLKNGFIVTGEAFCVSPENFDVQIGRRIARENARNKIWPLLGYMLREQLVATGVV